MCLSVCVCSAKGMSHGGGWDVGMKANRKVGRGGGGEGKDGGKSSTSSVGVDLALRWLRKLHVLLARHEPSQLQQHHPDTVGVLPLGQRSHRMHVNLQDRTSKDGCDVTP